MHVTKQITNVVKDTPLTVDIERGFSKTESLSEIIENVGKVIALGAVGINIEDGLPKNKSVDDLDLFCTKVSEIAKLKKELQLPFVINARTDIYLLQQASDSLDTLFSRTVERAQALKECGADCIFIPGALGKETIQQLRDNIELPINLFVHPKFHDVNELNKIGINRLSSGSAPVRTIFNNLLTIGNKFTELDCKEMLNHPFNYAAANDFFRK